MKILVLNSGSSSLRFQLIETSLEQIANNSDRVLTKGRVERIGSSEALVSFECGSGKGSKFSKPIPEHKQAVEEAIRCLTELGKVATSLSEIEAVGHRVVHGGEHFVSSILIDEEVVHKIESCIDLAPLHNPNNLKGYYAARAILPHAAHVAVFDTAFHQTLPPEVFHYGIPYVHYTRDRIRRYGFHGTSHRYLSYRFAQIRASNPEVFKLITCHLGNGCSVCAINQGRSVETSMGYTPLEGLLMGTRCGDIDPGAVFHLLSEAEMGLHELEVLMNRHSGLYGVSGISNDMRDLLRESERGDARATLAVKMFCHRVKKYIGAYLAVLGGADAIIFAGGIGENSPAVRAMICESLQALGARLDPGKNSNALAVEMEISVAGSLPQLWVIPTNEELLIARDTLGCILRA
jgi:acetate kinase